MICECIRCGKKLEDIMEGGQSVQPSGGIAFVTHGHYGSTVFDPMDGSWCEIVVCDECAISYFRETNPDILEESSMGSYIEGYPATKTCYIGGLDEEDIAREAQWSAFDKVLHWINTQEEKMISKGDLYDAVIEMRPDSTISNEQD